MTRQFEPAVCFPGQGLRISSFLLSAHGQACIALVRFETTAIGLHSAHLGLPPGVPRPQLCPCHIYGPILLGSNLDQGTIILLTTIFLVFDSYSHLTIL